jgi:hypothetical protein
MEFDLDELNPAAEFPYEDGSAVSLRVCPSDVVRDIERKYPPRVEYRDGNRFEYVPIETQNKRSEDIWDYCIVDWKGVNDKKAKAPMPCDRKNKIRLMGGSVKFARFVASCLEKLRAESDVRAEALEKNVETS